LTKGQQGLLGPSTASRWELIAGVNRERVNAEDQKQEKKEKEGGSLQWAKVYESEKAAV
jgi:hypothetical protein